MNSNYRSVLIWGVIALILIVSFSLFNGDSQRSGGGEISYSEFLQKVENNELKSVTIQGQKLTGQTIEHRVISTYAPRDPGLIQKLENRNVNVKAIPESSGNSIFLNLLFSLLPVIIIVGAWVFFMRQMQNGSRGAMGFGKSKAKLLNEAQGRVTFQDVAGVEEAKQDLQEIVEFLREPQKFQRLGGRIPRGVLLVGPPGTGKTLLARSVAGEANVPFFTISGSDFVEMFVGVGASRVRDMFEQAKKNSPCIIFIDEIDAVGRHRGAGLGGGNDEREQTLNQLLVEMDGFEPNESIILIAATNRPDVLDPALLRPGRFDRQVVVPNPDVSGREQILKVHVRNVPLAPNVDLKVLARGTPGFSGADLMNLVNEAALMAASRNKRVVTMQEFEDAKDKVMMGAERRSTAMTQEEKELTAYHEAGHAIVALSVPVADPVHKATIVPRGRALGMVMQLPEGDRYSMSYRWMISRLAIMMGGRVAEELKFGKENITSGAASDIEQATKLARAMITRWGFSDLLGNVAYGDNQDEVFLGHSVARTQNVSEETARMIDAEVRKLIDNAYKSATKILNTKRKEWFALAQGLLEYETLTGAEINEVIAGKPPSRTQKDESAPRVSSVPKTGVIKAEAYTSTADKTNVKKTDVEKTVVKKADAEKTNANKTNVGKAEPKIVKGTTKSSDVKANDAASQGMPSREMEKKTQSAKRTTKVVNRSVSKTNSGKKSNAPGRDKEKQEPSNDA
ncbi:ATP-dependent zinc metalloprotease FtsH [Bartonella sp. MM73XJBT]|uniref:ATP-dependent zinc metalloprotease FtsH n=1 Tax=Bartonella sp. MM73XJBT TaxID=3019095 RepID=UPI00235E2D42|nr:ATP-dependent zinc metalloprotease FtsH [Bartonella sp. MM73XJBT]